MSAPQTVEVKFKGTRKAYFLWPHADDPLHVNQVVVVEADRGKDVGRVMTAGEAAEKKCAGACTGCAVGEAQVTTEPLRAVVRRATSDDLRTHREVRKSEEDVRRRVIERVRTHGLQMKVSDTEWQWDKTRLTIYFTAEKRVDFRALVRDLASVFRTRIELRQIGVRDEAARLGGVGRCGKEYCCSTWLKELSPVNLGLAKDQHLSLNPSQISGGCGRLLCCLKYEHEFYVASRKRFPREGKSLRTAAGTEKVIAVDIFRERVYLRAEGQPSRIIALAQLQEEIAAAEPAAAAPAAPQAPERAPAPERRAPPAPERRAAPAEGRRAAPADEDTDAPGDDDPAPRRNGPRRRRRRRRRPGGDGPPPAPAA
jgi:cell fate regulator YaaT (PSP1 superfamily)